MGLFVCLLVCVLVGWFFLIYFFFFLTNQEATCRHTGVLLRI